MAETISTYRYFTLREARKYKDLLLKDRAGWEHSRYIVALDAIRAIYEDGHQGLVLQQGYNFAAIVSYTSIYGEYLDVNWLASNKRYPYSGKRLLVQIAEFASNLEFGVRIHSAESALGYYKKIGLIAPDPTFPSLFELTPEQARNFK